MLCHHSVVFAISPITIWPFMISLHHSYTVNR